MIKLKFLGRGSGLNPKEGNTSAYFEYKNNLFIFDCGGDVAGKLIQKGLLENKDRITVFITHVHDDHAGSLSTLIYYCKYILNKKPIIVCPCPSGLGEILKLEGVQPEDYERITFRMSFNKRFKDLFIRLLVADVVHGNMSAYSYAIEFLDGYYIYYSGDTDSTMHFLLSDLINNVKPDHLLLYHEACMYECPVHTSICRLYGLVPEMYRSSTYLMHIDSNFDEEYAKSLGFNVVQVEKEE